jgi:hypothetical protein
MKCFLIFVAFALVAGTVQGQNFSCRIGTRASCLDYGETICSSSGQCVGQNAACFDRYQCNYEGFTCKSNVTDAVDVYDELLRTHNQLVDEYNDLLDERDQLRSAGRVLARNLEDIKICLQYAVTLEDAQACEWQ